MQTDTKTRRYERSRCAGSARIRAAFRPAEAASRDAIADRLRTYADHFWLLFDDDRLTAAINGMVTDEPDLVDAMYADTSMHDERGAWQMLFSVCTDPGSRRERRASRLMRSVIEDARDAGRDGLVLTCKETPDRLL